MVCVGLAIALARCGGDPQCAAACANELRVRFDKPILLGDTFSVSVAESSGHGRVEISCQSSAGSDGYACDQIVTDTIRVRFLSLTRELGGIIVSEPTPGEELKYSVTVDGVLVREFSVRYDPVSVAGVCGVNCYGSTEIVVQ